MGDDDAHVLVEEVHMKDPYAKGICDTQDRAVHVEEGDPGGQVFYSV